MNTSEINRQCRVTLYLLLPHNSLTIQQQQMAQLQMQQMQVDNETKVSYSEAQHALAAERFNKTRLDAALSAERLQRADEDRTGALLNLIKAATEIKSMDMEQLEQAVRIMQSMSSSQEQPETSQNVNSPSP